MDLTMRCCKAVLAISLLYLTTACSGVHSAGTAYEPNPSPPPGYRAACASTPLPFNAFVTSCTPAAAEERVVVRAKG
jgi:hypothetical protein